MKNYSITSFRIQDLYTFVFSFYCPNVIIDGNMAKIQVLIFPKEVEAQQ
ncbi:hypothetical protein [Flavobacterium frigidarium]|jgi:hypothetical protein|nr:hypothetical protein [Flavobacterium frigidarium]